MKIIKYEHAFLVLENEGKRLAIDPGKVSASFPKEALYDYVIITHEHADHLSVEVIKVLFQKNPNVHFFINQKVYNEHLKPLSLKYTIIDAGVTAQVEGFELQFYGQDHAIIYKNVPCQNNGVLVNNKFYYPGDSFTLPNVPVDVVAVPAAAPWLKVSEAMDFITAVKPKKAFLMHDIMLSDTGQACTTAGAELLTLQIGVANDI